VSERVRGTVINLNAFGATVRLEDGRLATAPAHDVDAHRADYERAATARRPLDFEYREHDARAIVRLAPHIRGDAVLEEKIVDYLKSTGEWESLDGPPAHERHFLHKKKRAAAFENQRAPE